MEFLPRTMGTRPRLACEVRAEGVVAARAEDASAVLSAVSRAPLGAGVVIPQMRVTDAVRRLSAVMSVARRALRSWRR